MGVVQAVGSGSDSQKSQFQPLIARQNSWYNLPLDELESQFGGQGKAFGSMNLDELLKSMSSAEVAQPVGIGAGIGSSSALQNQGSTTNRSLSKRTVDEVWNDIQRGRNAGNSVAVKPEKESTWGKMTLEDFLTKAGVGSEESSLGPVVGLDAADTPQCLSAQYTLSPAPSIGTLSDAMLGSQGGGPETVVERKLKRKIKNRESAARSRARKQAYHNELVGKVSSLEVANIKLRKEKEFDDLCPVDLSNEVKYQLRRTSSASF